MDGAEQHNEANSGEILVQDDAMWSWLTNMKVLQLEKMRQFDHNRHSVVSVKHCFVWDMKPAEETASCQHHTDKINQTSH